MVSGPSRKRDLTPVGGSSVHWTERSIASIVAGRWPSPHSPTSLHCCQRLSSGLRPGAHTEVCAALHGLGHRACGHRPRVDLAVPRRTTPPTFTGSCLPSTVPPSRALETHQAPPKNMGDKCSSHGLSLQHSRVHSRPTRGCVFGTPEPTGVSCSVLVVSLHLDGLLRVSCAGLLHPADGPGVRRVSSAEADSPRRCGPYEVSHVVSRTRSPGPSRAEACHRVRSPWAVASMAFQHLHETSRRVDSEESARVSHRTDPRWPSLRCAGAQDRRGRHPRVPSSWRHGPKTHPQRS